MRLSLFLCLALFCSGCSLLVDSKLDDKNPTTDAAADGRGETSPPAEAGAETSPDGGTEGAPPVDELCGKPPVALGDVDDPMAPNQVAIVIDGADNPSVAAIARGGAVVRHFWDATRKKWASHAVNVPAPAPQKRDRVAAAFDGRDRLHVIVGRGDPGATPPRRELLHVVYDELPQTTIVQAPKPITGTGSETQYVHAASGPNSIWFATASGSARGVHRINLVGATNFSVKLCPLPSSGGAIREYSLPRVAVSWDGKVVANTVFFSETTPTPGRGYRVDAFNDKGGCPTQDPTAYNLRGAEHRGGVANLQQGPMVAGAQDDGTIITSWVEAAAGATPPGGTLRFGVFAGGALNVSNPPGQPNLSPAALALSLTSNDRAEIVVQALSPGGPQLAWVEEDNPWRSEVLATGGGPLVDIIVDGRDRLHIVYSRQGAGGAELAYECRMTLK